jgi:hypothetical protein
MGFRLMVAWARLFFHLSEFSEKIIDDLAFGGVHETLPFSFAVLALQSSTIWPPAV